MTTPLQQAAYDIGAKGSDPTEEERLAFESWMRGHCWAVIGDWDGKQYKHGCEDGEFIHGGAMGTRRLWAAWRDRGAVAMVLAEKSQAVEPIGYVRHADKTFWPHPEYAVYASVSPSLAPVYAHPAPPVEAHQVAVPPGWALVPIEPTKAMWAAVNKLDDEMAANGYDGKGCSIEQAWDCLLAAAAQGEKPVAQQAVPMTDAQIETTCRFIEPTFAGPIAYDLLIARAIEAHHGIGAKP